MSITINGYVNFVCNRCNKSQCIEAQAINFNEDTNPDATEESYVRYTSELATSCESCGNNLFISLDIWEHPTAVCNYSYYSDIGMSKVECEFSIEYFFDDALERAEERSDEQDEKSDESDDKDKLFNESEIPTGYKDQYDDTE